MEVVGAVLRQRGRKRTGLRIMLILFLCCVGCSSIQTAQKLGGNAKAKPPAVYLFYTPSETTVTGDSLSIKDMQRKIGAMEDWLFERCGGFSRWEIVGGWRNPSTTMDEYAPGYLYWISCQTVSAEEIAGKIKEVFAEQEAYVIEVPVAKYAK